MKYLYIKMNAKTPRAVYDNYVRQKPSNQFMFIIDFVHDQQGIEEKEITPREFDIKLNNKYYG